MKYILLAAMLFVFAACEKAVTDKATASDNFYYHIPGYIAISKATPSWETINGKKCFRLDLKVDTITLTNPPGYGVDSMWLMWDGAIRVSTVKKLAVGIVTLYDTAMKYSNGANTESTYSTVYFERGGVPVKMPSVTIKP